MYARRTARAEYDKIDCQVGLTGKPPRHDVKADVGARGDRKSCARTPPGQRREEGHRATKVSHGSGVRGKCCQRVIKHPYGAGRRRGGGFSWKPRPVFEVPSGGVILWECAFPTINPLAGAGDHKNDQERDTRRGSSSRNQHQRCIATRF